MLHPSGTFRPNLVGLGGRLNDNYRPPSAGVANGGRSDGVEAACSPSTAGLIVLPRDSRMLRAMSRPHRMLVAYADGGRSTAGAENKRAAEIHIVLTCALIALRAVSARRAAILLGCTLAACVDLELASPRLGESGDGLRRSDDAPGGPMADVDGGRGKDGRPPASGGDQPSQGGGHAGTTLDSTTPHESAEGGGGVASASANSANSDPVGDAGAFSPDASADCDAGICRVPLRSLGATCSSGSDCASSFCVHGACCEADCSGSCQLCSAAGHCYEVPRIHDTCRAPSAYECHFESKDTPESTRLSCVDSSASPELTMMYISHAPTSEDSQALHLLHVSHADEIWMPIRFTAFGFDANGNSICDIYPPMAVYPHGYCPPGIDCPTSQTTVCPSSPYSTSIYSYSP